ncbi:NAD-dependent epimerase/dehydratase family protein [Cupriavidus pauculus]|uniref:NAD-dependent epimerase/dehydratase family protein n=1 Tax=Cupriavidus pauculus TaxID=82633 RepID=UPI0038579B43
MTNSIQRNTRARCCVIGGAGFIGAWLVHELLATGREVCVLGRRPTRPAAVPAAAEYTSVGEGAIDWPALLAGADEIVDLAYATVPQTSYADPVYDILANLPLTVGLLEATRNLPLRRMIVVSSGGTVYGHVDSLPICENAPTNPVSPYGITKLTQEKYALMFHRLHGVPVSIVRPANAYGSGQRAFTGQGFIATAMGAILKRQEVTVFGEAGTIRDYIHVADVARGILAVLDGGDAGQVYNLGTGVGRNNREVLAALEPLAARHDLPVRIRLAAARDFDVRANVLDSTKLRECSGWAPVEDFNKGLSSMWDAIASDIEGQA